MANLEGEKFLDKIYQDLYMSDFVQHTKENKDTRLEAINKYMNRLEELHNMADSEEKKKYVTSSYFRKYIIKEENIPYGADKKAIISAQEESLKLWVNYLMDSTTTYPMWAKYWAFQGMLKMGTRDETKETYFKRNEKTLAPFVDANPEIIASCINFIVKSVNGDEIDDEELNKLNKMDSFNKIYSYFEKKFKNNVIEKSDSTDGIWVKYNQGSREDAIKLNKETANKNTGWCTSSSEDMAIKQVCGPYNDAPNGGDFYVYYTKDKNGEYKIPRIAIRLINNNRIGEIRGIKKGQNLEEDMISILEQQLKSMNNISKEDIEENLQIVDNLRMLTKINIKISKNEELTEDELIDLYTKKYGFGYQNDPKVEKILKSRNFCNDLNLIKDHKIKIAILKSYKYENNGIMLCERTEFIDNKKFMMELLKTDVLELEAATKTIRDDKDLINEAKKQLAKKREIFDYCFNKLEVDTYDEYCFIRNKAYILDSCNYEEIKDYEDFIINVAREAIEKYNYDKKVIEAVLKSIPEKYKYDKRIYFEIGKIKNDINDYIPSELFNDRNFILEMVNYNIKVLEKASSFKNDKEIFLNAIKENGNALEYASDKIKDDKNIVLIAVNNSGSSLQYASTRLKNDYDVILAAVKEDGAALEFASSDLKANEDIAFEVLKKGIWYFDKISNDLKNNPLFMLKVVSKFGIVYLKGASPELRKNYKFILDAVKIDPKAIDYTFLKRDESFIEEAIKINAECFKYIYNNLMHNREFVIKMAKINPNILNYLDDKMSFEKNSILKELNPEIDIDDSIESKKNSVLDAIRDGMSTSSIPADLMKDKKFMIEVFKINGDRLTDWLYSIEMSQEERLKIYKEIENYWKEKLFDNKENNNRVVS